MNVVVLAGALRALVAPLNSLLHDLLHLELFLRLVPLIRCGQHVLVVLLLEQQVCVWNRRFVVWEKRLLKVALVRVFMLL